MIAEENTTHLGMHPVSHPSLTRIASRFHVATPILELIRESIKEMVKTRKKWLGWPKNHRRYFIACLIQAHKEDQSTYRYVATGRNVPFVPRYYFDKQTDWTHIAP